MLDIARKALLLLGLIYGPHALANEAPDAPLALGNVTAHLLTHSDKQHLAHSGVDTSDMTGAPLDWHGTRLQLEFQDSSALGKMRKIRAFSLLTLAETKRSRLFLGLNKRGLFGLHFSSTRQASPDRVLELARMPYLRREETVTAVTQ